MAKEAITTTVAMTFGEDEILRVRIFENAVIDLDDIINYYEIARRMTEGQSVLVMLDARANYRITKSAQEYAAKQSHTRIASAVVTTNPFSRLISNIYYAIFRPVSPFRLFSDEEKALDWLFEVRQNAKDALKEVS